MKSPQSSHSPLFLWATYTHSMSTPARAPSFPWFCVAFVTICYQRPVICFRAVIYLCLLVFKGLFLLSVHCSTLSLSDFPPEGSSWRRHPSDSARQEPGPEGRSGKGLHWRRAVFSAAWSLHRLPGVSISIIYGLLLLFHNSAHVGLYLVCLHNLIWIPLPYSFIFDIIYAVKWQGFKKNKTNLPCE